MSDVSLVNTVDLQVTNTVDSLSLLISDISTTKNTTVGDEEGEHTP